MLRVRSLEVAGRTAGVAAADVRTLAPRPGPAPEPAEPDSDRDDHQMLPQHHGAAVVDRSTHTLEASWRRWYQATAATAPKTRKSIPRRRHSGGRDASCARSSVIWRVIERRPAAYSATPVARNPTPAPSRAETIRLAGEALAKASADSTKAAEIETQCDTQQRPDSGECKGAQRMHAEEVTPIGAADPQDRLFPTQRTGQHAARVRGEESRPAEHRSPRKTNMRFAVRASSLATRARWRCCRSRRLARARRH